MMGHLALGGEVIVPWAVRAAFALFKLFLGQGVVSGILAVPRDPAACSSSQPRVGSCYDVGVVRRGTASDASVSPCQFTSLIILIYQFQEPLSHIGPDEPLTNRFSSAYVSKLVYAKLGSPLLRVRF